MNDRIQDAFDKIHAEDALKERTLAYVERQTEARRKKKQFAYGRLAAAVACFAVVLGLGGGYLYVTPVSAISLDINPSIEMGINRFDRVISVRGYNDDGAEMVMALDVKNKKYEDAIREIFSSEEITRLLEENARMEVTVASDDETECEKILSRVENCTSHHENVSCHSANYAYAKTAHAMGFSLGKYRAYLALLEVEPEVTVEEVKDLTMQEIRRRIEAHGGAFVPGKSEGGCDDTEAGTGIPQTECGEDTRDHEPAHGSGAGNGAGNGNGSGSGARNGNGSGTGVGNGNETGSGAGAGEGRGSGTGTGTGTGTGSGAGSGNGHGSGSGNGHGAGAHGHGNGHE